MNNIRSAWGRWGPKDQRGAVNLLAPSLAAKAIGLVKVGKVYSLGAPVGRLGPIGTRNATHHYVTIHQDSSVGGAGSADDVLVTHCHASTHLDALSHHWYDGLLYNGHPATGITPRGAGVCGVENVGGILTRGLMLDIPAVLGLQRLPENYAITPRDLDAALEAENVAPQAGDVVLVRTGWYSAYLENPQITSKNCPGLDTASIRWISRYDLVAIGADNAAVEIWPPQQRTPDEIEWHRKGILPLHAFVLRDLGVYLMEFINLEDLASDRVFEFLFVAMPLRIIGGVGSPINPLAVV